jgi:hypothetical protein
MKTFQEAINNLNKYRRYINDPNKISEIDASINRAQNWINKMQPALSDWNKRVLNYPNIWSPDGTSKAQPDWPSDPVAATRRN